MAVTVATSTVNIPMGDPRQRQIFFALGLHWLFYYEAAGWIYRTSSDGLSWSDKILVGAGSTVGSRSLVYDESSDSIHTLTSGGTTGWYKRGDLSSDGTITWSAVQNIAMDDIYYSMIAIDSDGYPWIGCNNLVLAVNHPTVNKSSTKDGTWTTDAGFPYELSAIIVGAFTYAYIVPLTGGKVYALYGTAGAKIYGKLYSAGAWGAEEVVSSSTTQGAFITASNYQDTVKVAFTSSSNARIYYVERDASGTWSTETEIFSEGVGDAQGVPQLCVDQDNGVVYVIWAYDGSVYIMRKIGDVLDPCYAWITGEGLFPFGTGAGANMKTFVNIPPKKYGRYIGVGWGAGSASPYNVRFTSITILPVNIKNSKSL